MLMSMFKGTLIAGMAVLLAVGNTWPDVADRLVSVIGTVLLAWIAYRQFIASQLQKTAVKVATETKDIAVDTAEVVKNKIDENTAVTKEVQEKVNGKMDQLVHAEKTASFLAGKKMGENETTHRLEPKENK